jgi:hypothetical protein
VATQRPKPADAQVRPVRHRICKGKDDSMKSRAIRPPILCGPSTAQQRSCVRMTRASRRLLSAESRLGEAN